MLRPTLYFRRFVTFAVLPPLALLAGACSSDSSSSISANGGEAGASPAAASAGTAGAVGSGTDSGVAAEAGLPDAPDGSTTAAPPAGVGPAPVLLGMASQYAILAKSAISNVPTSMISGNLGLSPAAASYITGFSLTKSGTKWTSPQVVGGVFAADNDPPTAANLTTAIADMQTAYTDAAGRSMPGFLNLGAGAIGGLTLKPGLYKWTSAVTIPADLTLTGSANDVWIFQITGDLELSAAKAISLAGDAQSKNVFWQVAGAVHLGTTSHAEGVILAKTAIAVAAGATINGQLLAQTAVNIASCTVTAPSP